MFKLLTATNPKMMKSIAYGYLTAILHLSPYKLSGANLCPKASTACVLGCLNTSGQGILKSVQNARLERSKLYLQNRVEFLKMLYADIAKLERQALKQGLKVAVRLNGTSDIPKLAIQVAKDFPHIQFYDYTKILATLKRDDLPSNYYLTFSRSESNESDCLEALNSGFNVAMVFDKVPETYRGFEVINGDEHDLRFLDKQGLWGFVVGLKAKGKARQDASGFVIRGA